MEEMVLYEMDMSIEKLEDFVRRAKAAGHNSFDTIVEKGYYGDVENITLRSEFKP